MAKIIQSCDCRVIYLDCRQDEVQFVWGRGSATAGAIITDRSASPDIQVKVGQILDSGFLDEHQSVAMGRSGYPGPKLPQDLLDKVQCMFAKPSFTINTY